MPGIFHSELGSQRWCSHLSWHCARPHWLQDKQINLIRETFPALWFWFDVSLETLNVLWLFCGYLWGNKQNHAACLMYSSWHESVRLPGLMRLRHRGHRVPRLWVIPQSSSVRITRDPDTQSHASTVELPSQPSLQMLMSGMDKNIWWHVRIFIRRKSQTNKILAQFPPLWS